MDRFFFDFKDDIAQAKDKKDTPPVSDPGKTAYLTFDDGPSEFTPRLLEILNKNSVKATFFVSFQGEDTPEKRKILMREAEEGNSIGIHSWTHDYFSIYANEENFKKDFQKMRGIIRDATGMDPKISRFPGGTGNSVSIIASCGETIMPRLLRDVEAMGVKPFDWNAGGQDAELPYPTTRQLIRDIVSEADRRDNPVILLHDTHQFSIDAVQEIIQSLRVKGYGFKALDPRSPTVRQPFATKTEVLSSLKRSLRLIGEFITLLESK